MTWYLIHTKPAQEERARLNLEQQGYQTFLPLCTVERVRRGKLIHAIEPLFKRYLFINLDEVSSNWYPIRSTRGVHTLVRFGIHSQPTVVPDRLIEALQAFVEKSAKALSQGGENAAFSASSLFKEGEALTIDQGPFTGLSGLFEKLLVSKDGEVRALLLVELLGKSQRLSIEVSHLQR